MILCVFVQVNRIRLLWQRWRGEDRQVHDRGPWSIHYGLDAAVVTAVSETYLPSPRPPRSHRLWLSFRDYETQYNAATVAPFIAVAATSVAKRDTRCNILSCTAESGPGYGIASISLMDSSWRHRVIIIVSSLVVHYMCVVLYIYIT